MSESDKFKMEESLARKALKNLQKRNKTTDFLPDITHHHRPEKSKADTTQQPKDIGTRQIGRSDTLTDPSKTFAKSLHSGQQITSPVELPLSDSNFNSMMGRPVRQELINPGMHTNSPQSLQNSISAYHLQNEIQKLQNHFMEQGDQRLMLNERAMTESSNYRFDILKYSADEYGLQGQSYPPTNQIESSNFALPPFNCAYSCVSKTTETDLEGPISLSMVEKRDADMLHLKRSDEQDKATASGHGVNNQADVRNIVENLEGKFGYSPGKLTLLSLDTDRNTLTQYQCVLRQQIYFFQASTFDVQASAQGRNRPIRLGQIGIVCRHCAMLPPGLRSSGAVYFPSKLSGIYQSAQNMVINHFSDRCSRIPDSLRSSLIDLKCKKNAFPVGIKQYWMKAAESLQVIEEDGVLVFSNGKRKRQTDEFDGIAQESR